MRILVTRPEPDASRQAGKLAARGHAAVLAPLLVIEPIANVALPLEGAQVLLVTSRNALSALATHRQLAEALSLPLFGVGEATARAAQGLGFADVTAGPGTGEALAKLVSEELQPSQGPLVHLAGETQAFDLKAALANRGFTVRQPVLYRALAASELPPEALSLLKAGKLDGAILMSPRTAGVFAGLLHRQDTVTQATSVVCYCLSEAVAEAVIPLGWPVRVAARPREQDVLALVDSEAASS
ncbi:MAG TPA: uroporphyrinogen-III synthase [Methyloceanibacter sp.]